MESFTRPGVAAGSNESASLKTHRSAAQARLIRETRLKPPIGIRQPIFTKTMASTSVQWICPASIAHPRYQHRRRQANGKGESSGPEATRHRAECPAANFCRTFSVPASVDQSDIRADYKDGVLKVRLPKRPERKAAAS